MVPIHIYPVRLHEFHQRLDLLSRLAGDAEQSTEGWHVLLKFSSEADRVASALALGEVAKAYRSSLLVCADASDPEVEEGLRFVTSELAPDCRAYRFLWLRGKLFALAVARALMPLDPIKDDPRGVWEKLP